jgi:hypothetical protein
VYLAEKLNVDLDELLEVFAPLVHTHAASDIVSGTLDAARIPNLDASKITTGTMDNARLDSNITHDDVAETISARWTHSVAITGTNTPRCKLFHNTTQSTTNDTETAVAFNSEDFDVGTMHDNATNNSRITIPANEDGLYLITGIVSFASNATGFRTLSLFKNGGGTAEGSKALLNALTAAATTRVQLTTLLTLAAGDYIELFARQTSGGNLNIGNATRENGNQFEAVRLW